MRSIFTSADWLNHPRKLSRDGQRQINFTLLAATLYNQFILFHNFLLLIGPCGARGRCRISPPRFLAECRKRRPNQGSFVSSVRLVVCFLWFVLCLCVYFCDLYSVFPYCLFVSNSQVIGCEDRLRNDLYSVMLNEAKISRPRPGPWGRDRGQSFEVKAEANFLTSRLGRGQRLSYE